MSDKQRIIIFGGTSGIAEHCVRLWCRSPVEILLVGRDTSRLQAIADDLQIRSPESKVNVEVMDFVAVEEIEKTCSRLAGQFNPNKVLIAHGSLPDQQECQVDLHKVQQALEINGQSPVLIAEVFATYFQRQNHGQIIMLSSVAGDRGRQSNYIYGAAKAMVTTYAEGLQHRLVGSKASVLLVKPGPTATAMTAHLLAQGVNLAKPEDVAKQIVVAAEKHKSELYTPSKWWLIMLVIRNLPRLIFHRLKI